MRLQEFKPSLQQLLHLVSITPRVARERKHILRTRNQLTDLVPVFELIVEKFMTLVDNQTLIPHIPYGDAESAVAALDPPLWKSYPLHYFSYQATKISYLAQQISYSWIFYSITVTKLRTAANMSHTTANIYHTFANTYKGPCVRHFITTTRPPRRGRQRATIEAGPTPKTPRPTVVTASLGMQNGVLCCSGHRPSK